ncbi:hypothetical protein D3C86_1508340 [compost metagenome]
MILRIPDPPGHAVFRRCEVKRIEGIAQLSSCLKGSEDPIEVRKVGISIREAKSLPERGLAQAKAIRRFVKHIILRRGDGRQEMPPRLEHAFEFLDDFYEIGEIIVLEG